jgi:DNA adenine methylase
MNEESLKMEGPVSEWSPAEWHILLAKFCSQKPGPEQEKTREMIRIFMKELIRRGDFTFHPETYSKCAKETALNALEQIMASGIYLVPPHGQMLYDGRKTAVVKLIYFKDLPKQFHYLCSGKMCFGAIRFKEAIEIDLEEFEQLRDKHRISDEERKRWWPAATHFYLYEVRDYFRFLSKVRVPQGIQTIIKRVQFLSDSLCLPEDRPSSFVLQSELPEDAIRGLSEIDEEEIEAFSLAKDLPSLEALVEGIKKISNVELLHRHAAIHAIAEELDPEKSLPEDVVNTHKIIVHEMERRGLEHRKETRIDGSVLQDLLPAKRLVSITALGTRANVEESSEKHKKHTGVFLSASGKTLLLDIGEPEYLDLDPDIVLVSHTHPDHFNIESDEESETEDENLEDLFRPLRTYGSSIDSLIAKFEIPEHRVYCEPFAGSGAFFFRKKPVEVEVLNDLEPNLVWALRFLKNMTKSEFDALCRYNWELSQSRFDSLAKIWKAGKFKSRVHKFYVMRYLMRTSHVWSGKRPSGFIKSSEGQKFNPARFWPAHERIKDVKIFQKDYKELVKEFDSADTFFFFDPPYRRHQKYSYSVEESVKWDEFYEMLKKLKGKAIVLQSNSEEDKKALKRAGFESRTVHFVGGSLSGVKRKPRILLASNFKLKKKLGATRILQTQEAEIFESEELSKPRFPVILARFSKTEQSEAAEKVLNIEYANDWEWGPFKCQAFPSEHSTVAPTAVWRIKVAGLSILFAPDILDFDKKILAGIDIYIGDGSSFTKDIVREGDVGHLSIKHQIERCKEAGVKEIYLIHIGKELIDKPALEAEVAKLGARVLSDGEEIEKNIQLVNLESVLSLLPGSFSTEEKYFLVGSLATSGRGVDIDILERGEPDDAARFRILKALEPFRDRLSFVEGGGPFTGYIPLYTRTYVRRLEEVQPLEALPSGEFADLTLEGQALKDAEASRREDKIQYFRFFALQKTHAGYHAREAFSVEEALEMLREDRFPYVGEEKIDGYHVSCFKKGDKIVLFSEDGKEQNQTQCPNIIQALKAIKGDFVCVGEINAWAPEAEAVKAGLVPEKRPTRDGKVHLGRGDVTGYMHSKKYDPLIDKSLLFTVYDLLLRDGEELFKEPLEKRIAARQKLIPKDGPVYSIESVILKTPAEVGPFYEKVIKRPSAEGIMLKPEGDRYVLWYFGGLWVKIKCLYELSAQVLKVHRAETKAGKPLNVWNAACAVRAADGKGLIYVGTTYNTPIKLKPGDIIEVRFQNISRYLDDATDRVWYNWWRPCCPPGTPILTEEGLKAIEKVRRGERVLGLNGAFTEVISVSRRLEAKRLIRLKTVGSPPIEITENHLVPYTLGKNSEIKWSPAGSLTPGAFLLLPRPDFSYEFKAKTIRIKGRGTRKRKVIWNDKTTILGDEDDFYIFGLWLAEGNFNSERGKKTGLVFTFHKEEERLQSAVIKWASRHKLHASVTSRKGEQRNSVQIGIASQKLADLFCKWFGKGAYAKFVSFQWLGLEPSLLSALITGIFDGDGSIGEKETRLSLASSSLATFTRLALLKLGTTATLHEAKRWRISRSHEHFFVETSSSMIGLPSSDYFTLLKRTEGNRTRKKYRMKLWKHAVGLRLLAVEEVPYRGFVYDLQTKDSTYLIKGGIAVHNCVIDKRIDKKEPDTTEIADRLVKATSGEVGTKPLPKKAREALGMDYEMGFEPTDFVDISQEEDLIRVAKQPPLPAEFQKELARVHAISRTSIKNGDPEKLPEGFFILENHFRGQSVHMDFRLKEDGALDGETFLSQIEGVPDEPVRTLEEAKAYYEEWRRSPEKVAKVYPDLPQNKGWMISEKETQPLEWLQMIDTIIEPGQVGSTKEFPGVFFLLDYGLAFRTVKKPWFQETWIFGKDFKGLRYVARMIPTQKGYKKAGKLPVFWRAHFADPASPPYVFSPSFFQQDEWVPTESALPPQWEAVIPEKLRWWDKDLPKKNRLELIKASFNFLVEEKFLSGRKISLDKEEFSAILSDEGRKFILHRIWWRGPAHVRFTPFSVWRLRIQEAGEGLLTFEFEEDPSRESERGFAALRFNSKIKPPAGSSVNDWFSFQGAIPAGHPENPNKEIAAYATIVDKGEFKKVADSSDFYSGKFKGKMLSGYYIFKRESPKADLWLFRRGSLKEKKEKPDEVPAEPSGNKE